MEPEPGTAQLPGAPLCVVTGATRGIGRALTIELARRGCALVLIGRDEEAARHLRAELREPSGAPVGFVQADLGVQQQVREAAARIASEHAQVDVLVNNAGIYTTRPRTSEDGVELTVAVNHLAPFLLTRLLLPALHAAPRAHVINVASRVERLALSMRAWARPRRSGGLFGLLPYARSKRAMLHATRELAHRLRDAPVRVNSVHPGFVATDLLRDFPSVIRRMYEPLLTTAEASARLIADLATAPQYTGYSGAHFEPGPRLARTSRGSYRAAERHAVWLRSCELVGLPEDL